LNVDASIAPPDEPDPGLGRVIRRLREQRGLSQAELADRARIEPAALAQIEAGTADPPWATVAALADGLGVSVESIAGAVTSEDADTP